MENLVKKLKALADFKRLRIFIMVCQRPLCVCELDAALDAPLPTISNNLKILKNAGMVSSHKDGRWIIYQMHEDALVKNIYNLILSEYEGNDILQRDIQFIASITRQTCYNVK